MLRYKTCSRYNNKFYHCQFFSVIWSFQSFAHVFWDDGSHALRTCNPPPPKVLGVGWGVGVGRCRMLLTVAMS